jgi:hypothetical protein
LECCISAAFFRVVRRLSSEPASAWHVSPARACADESTALPGWPGCRRSDSSNGPRRPWCRQCAGAPALRRVDPHSRTCGGLKTSRALLRYALFRVRNRAQMSEGAPWLFWFSSKVWRLQCRRWEREEQREEKPAGERRTQRTRAAPRCGAS